MSSRVRLTFVVAVNSRDILEKNLLASPCLNGTHDHQLIVQEGFTSAASAYNNAIDRSSNDLIVFVHQDVFLPEPWLGRLEIAWRSLASDDLNWGVLGCWGHKQDGPGFGHVYTPGEGVIGRAFSAPVQVQTLDEVVLIIKRSSGLRFDGSLPGFHLYGTDICMTAAAKGLGCYAISAFCIHNARQYFSLPPEFWQCYRRVKRVWRDSLPIQTSCVRISRFDVDYRRRRLRQAWSRVLDRSLQRGNRAEDPRLILEELEAGHRV